MSERRDNWGGMNWIRQEKRLAIYLRDGLACIYCGAAVEDGTQLTLDHVKPVSKGGTNKEGNLVTACLKCNTSRGVRTVTAFCKAVAEYVNHEIKAEDIQAGVKRNTSRKLGKYMVEAKELISRRGSAAKVLAEKQKIQI
jgi:hypothetical protein